MRPPFKKTLLWLCLLALAVNCFSLATMTVLPWNATDGITWHTGEGWSDVIVSDVQNPASKAGIRSGDRMDIRDYYNANGYTSTVAGIAEHLPVVRDGRRLNFAVVAAHIPIWWPFIFRAIAVFWLLGFTVLIIVRAPQTKENTILAAFLICWAFESQLSRMTIPNVWLNWFSLCFESAFYSAGCVLLALYAGRFAVPLSRLRLWELRLTIAVAAIGAVAQVFVTFPLAATSLVGTDPLFEMSTGILPLVLALLALALAIGAAPKSEKQRIGWVLAGFAFFTIGFAMGEQSSILGPLRLVQEIGFAAIPLALTYAALARRMFDIGFILNRAAVFAVVSALIVAAFVVLEWSLAKWFEDASHTTSLALNAGLALGIGFSMRFIHHHVDRFIDTVFFRKRHENETALRRFGREAGFMTDRDTLLERTRDEVLARTDASSARILLTDELPKNDPAVLALQAWHEPLDLNRYETSIQGDYAFPMVAHGKLTGTLVCGEKRNAEHYAPDEVDALSTVAHGVGLALSELERRSDEQPAFASILAGINARLDAISAAQAALLNNGKRVEG